MMFIGCSGTPTPQENATQEIQSPAEKVKEKANPQRRSYTPEELNEPYSKVSPWRYIVTSPETQYFERLVGKSTQARVVHSSGHAILVPQDETFTTDKNWKGILDEEQQDALDRFVKAHVIVGIKG
ncbi:hypothetical protein N9C70_05645, partial [Flavobacteriales bacterium]|nr:hypothetical protein [Flavobacteriales bacterium]